MELIFTITAPDLRVLADAERASRMARANRRVVTVRAAIDQWMHRWHALVSVALGLLASAIALYLPERRIGVEPLLALGILTIACVLLFRRCLRPLSHRLYSLSRPLRDAAEKSIMQAMERSLASQIHAEPARLEGTYRVRIGPEAMMLMPPGGKVVSVPWRSIVEVRETEAFYLIDTKWLKRLGLCYPIAKHSTEMTEAEYQDGLHRLLQEFPAIKSARNS